MKDSSKNMKDEAAKWWALTTRRGEYVVSADKTPAQRQREFLVKESFLCRATRGYWILKKPEDSLEDVFPLLFWQAVEVILARVGRSSIRGESALRILNGDQGAQEHLLVGTEKKTNWKISLPLGYAISLAYDPAFDERLIRNMQVGDRTLPVDVPERVLVDIAKLPSSAGTRTFLAGTDFDLRTIDAIYATRPKPVVFKRLAGIAGEVDRPELARALEGIIQTRTHYQVVKRASGDRVDLVARPKPLAPPWVLRQEEQFRVFRKDLEKHLSRKMAKLKRRSLETLVAQAKEHKRYDTYHSTTLEGYRITPEEVDALLSGAVPKDRKNDGGKYAEEVRNRMAILGYSEAFDFVLNRAERDFGRPEVSEQLIKDVYYHLFKPSADAGIVDYLSLTTWRNTPAFIRGTPYAPPSHEKLPELMASFENSLKQVKNAVVAAILAHYWFVTIHPYLDGNGRTARLLMDYLLVSCGHPWVTIRVDQRIRYFDALKDGQVDGDILPFGEYILESIKAAGRDTRSAEHPEWNGRSST